MKKIFWWGVGTIVIFGLVSKLCLLRGNNLFFTVDQGRDAVYVREILESGRIFFKGPETSVRGVFTGPLWYYFVAVGYMFAGGHPVGGVLSLVLLNLGVSVFLILWLRRRIGDWQALVFGGALQISWAFFETSLWSFNPFVSVALGIWLVTLMVEFIEGNGKKYIWGYVPIFLALNSDLAPAAVFMIFYILVGIWGYWEKRLKRKEFIILGFGLPLVGVVIIGRQFVAQFLQAGGVGGGGLGVFSGMNFLEIGGRFARIIGEVVVPQNWVVGVVIFGLIVFYYFKNKRDKFVFLSLILLVISFLFFGSNMGWRAWHTVYLAPLLYVSLLIMLVGLKKVGYVGVVVVVLLQSVYFYQKYTGYLLHSSNPSLLYNEMVAVDWVYENSEKQGFKVYNYTDTFKDYPYQYLFWWYGLDKYGYLPDEYANYPLSPKETYIPGSIKYVEPKRSGERLTFLIIQSGTNGENNSDWIDKFRGYFNLKESIRIGDIVVEKYERIHDAPNDPCIWWEDCVEI